jgi:type I restriction enzyme R subunit
LIASLPEPANEIVMTTMNSPRAHTATSMQALESEKLRSDMKDVLLGAGRLWEGLRGRALGGATQHE